MLQTQRRVSLILILLLVIIIGALLAVLTLFLSSPLESGTVGPLLTSGVVFLLILLVLSLWLSSFLRSALFRPSVHYEQYGSSRFVPAVPFGPAEAAGEGGRVPMTVFYSNIRGFSSYSEQYEGEKVLRTLHRILEIQTELIRELNGGIETYIGDKVVALFSKQDAALDACKAALRVQHALSGEASEAFDGLKASIGIHTGEVIAGNPQSTGVMGAAVIGDTFNAASRLCGAAAAGQILICSRTYELVGDLIHVDGPYRLKNKGSEQYMTVYFLKEMLDESEE